MEPTASSIGRIAGPTTTFTAEENNRILERFTLLSKATQDSIWDWNLDTNELWWNEGFCEMFGYSKEEIEPGPESWYNRIHPDDRDRVVQGIHDVIDHGGEHWKDEYRFRRADGLYATVFDRGYTLHRDGRAIRMLGSMQDVTLQRQAAESQKENEDRLRIAVDSTGLGTWDLNPQTGVLKWSDRCKELFGLAHDAYIDYSIFLQGVHPDDREMVDRLVADVLAPGSDGSFELEYRTIGIGDGKLRWLKAKGRAFFDKSQKPTRFIGTVLDITEQKQAEEFITLQVRVLESMDEGVSVSDEHGNILYTNAAENRMFGYAEGELIGQHVTVQNAYDPKENERRVAEVIGQLRTVGIWNGEWHNIRKNGTPFYTFSRITALSIGGRQMLVCVQRDITEEKKNKEALAYQNQLVQTIADNATSALFMMDSRGYCTFMNRAGEKMFGYSQEEVRTRPLHDLIHHHYPDGSPYPRAACIVEGARLNRNELRAHQDLFFHKNGRSFPVSCSASPIYENDIPVAAVIEVRDISKELEAKQQLERNTEELERRVKERTFALQQANLELERSNQDLEQFAYVASHDLQEPLRKIRTFAHRLKELIGHDEVQTTSLEKILASSERMSALISDLLNYSRLTRSVDSFQPIELQPILDNVISDFEVSMQQKNAVIHIKQRLPRIEAIPLQMNQLFYNLISNSLKFVRHEVAPFIQVGCRQLLLGEQEEMGLDPEVIFYELRFTDNGIGFEEEYMDKIFTIFQRLHSRVEFEGTGIGLALCKKVVDFHHGAIRAQARPGEGASFLIYLPERQTWKGDQEAGG